MKKYCSRKSGVYDTIMVNKWIIRGDGEEMNGWIMHGDGE